MGPEFWVGLAAVFVSGGAVGAAGTLLAQWIVRKLGTDDLPRSASLEEREVGALRGEMDEMARRLENLDARLDFQEQLLGGATPTGHPPKRLPPQDGDDPGS
jgi:hypothetical protein